MYLTRYPIYLHKSAINQYLVGLEPYTNILMKHAYYAALLQRQQELGLKYTDWEMEQLWESLDEELDYYLPGYQQQPIFNRFVSSIQGLVRELSGLLFYQDVPLDDNLNYTCYFPANGVLLLESIQSFNS